jgi:lipid II:glycine glycyltransferase (peptidoglycan interpeptide bridge formation enzyme)
MMKETVTHNLPERECNGITIDCSESPLYPEWDCFLNHLPGAHHEQMGVWAQFRLNYGWRPVRWVARREGRILGGVQVLVHPLPRLGYIGYVVHGPMCEEGHRGLEEQLVERATAYAREHRFVYQVFDCPYTTATLDGILDRRGYMLHPLSVPPTGLITATLILDIQPGLDSILRTMRTTVRQNIKVGEKAGFEVMLGGEQHLDTFWELMLTICRRRGAAPTPSQPDFFKKLWEVMGPSGYVRLFLVRLGEEVVSAAFAFTVGDTIRVWKVGWSGAHHYKYPNHLMWWSIIKWAKENGFKFLDFVWVDDHDAKLLAQGEKRPEAFRDGTTFFKMGFGGRLVLIPGARSQFFHPVLRVFVGAGGMRLLNSRIAQQVLRRLWNRSTG